MEGRGVGEGGKGLSGLVAEYSLSFADIKANNILVEWKKDDHETVVIEQVQLADIEDAAYVPPGSDIIGKQVGNWIWRSPEAHAQGRVNKYSDIFSFGVVVSQHRAPPFPLPNYFYHNTPPSNF